MRLSRKAQSVAEYAIVIALVAAVAAGVMQMMLKGGMRTKSKQAVNYLLDAGNDTLTNDASVTLFSSEGSATNVTADSYTKTMRKGGGETAGGVTTSITNSVSLETATGGMEVE